MRRAPAVLLTLALAACSDTGGPSLQLLPNLEIIGGNDQVDTVAKTLSIAIAARATDRVSAEPRPGVVLNWFRVSGTDTVFLGAGATNDSGIARLTPTLGTRSGAQRFVSVHLDNEGNRAVVAAANATALAGPLAYSGFTAARARVLGDTTVRLPATATDAYGNAVALPAIEALDGLEAPKDTAPIVAAAAPGVFRFVFGTDTFRLFVHVPEGAWRSVQVAYDTTWEQTGSFSFVCFTAVTKTLCNEPGADSLARYRITDYVSRRIVSGVAVDSVQFAEFTGAFEHLAGPSLSWAFHQSPAGPYQTTVGSIVGLWQFARTDISAPLADSAMVVP